ncbi:MAG: glycosyltransferase family 2 protein [bacterium]
MDQNKISIIVVSYNTRELTRKCLAAILASAFAPQEIIVADNNSQDDSVEMIRNDFPNVKLIINNENLGFAKANNQAIATAGGDYIFLLNSDTEIGKNTLQQMFDYLEHNSQVAGVVPQLIYPDGSWQSVGGYFPTILNVLRYLLPITFFFPEFAKKKLKDMAIFRQEIPDKGMRLDYITGAAAMFRKAVLDRVGFLGEEYFMYFEETDLCWRINRAGYKLMAIKTEPMVHVYGGSYKSRHDPERLKMFLQSLRIFVKKNYGGFKKRMILFEILLLGKLSLKIKNLKQ